MKIKKKRPFKIDLLTCFFCLICFTIIIVLYSYKTYSKNIIDLVTKLASTTLDHAVSKTTQQINIAQYTPALSSSLLAEHLDIINDQQLESHIIKVLKQTPFLFMYYIGDEQGNFIIGYRNKYNSISTKIINRKAKQPFSLWKYRNEKEVVYKEKTESNPDFDPRIRPWYIGAKNSLQPYWTEIYSFYNKEADNAYAINNTNKSLYGISISNPIINNQQKLIGVVGVDISLTGLSQFLSSLKMGNNGKALMVNNFRQLILYPLVDSEKLMTTPEQQGMRVENIDIDWLREGTERFFRQHEKDFFYTYQGQDYFFKAHDFSTEIGKPWYLVVVVPVDDFLDTIKANRVVNLSITCFMLLLSILFSLWLSRNLAKPLETMTRTMKQVSSLNFASLEYLSSPIREFQQMSDALNSMTQGLKAFLKYVPPEVVVELIKKGENVTLGGHELNLSIFFSDIESFTEIAEDSAPMEIMTDLTYYFDQMVKVIVLDNQGTVDKFIGDAVMAFWGAPNYTTDHARLSCLAALQCQAEIAKLNEQRVAAKKRVFNTRIGIHTGIAIVGNIGSSDRFNYTIVGDNVNLASRLEGLNKLYHSNILVSHTTYRQTYQFFVFRPLDFVMVKGKNEGMKIYQLLAEKDQCDEQTLVLAEQAAEAFKYYLAKDFKAALKIYLQILARYSNDKPSKVMIEKCYKFIETPPDENWTGATRIFEK
jgi:adenylate cyclase